MENKPFPPHYKAIFTPCQYVVHMCESRRERGQRLWHGPGLRAGSGGGRVAGTTSFGSLRGRRPPRRRATAAPKRIVQLQEIRITAREGEKRNIEIFVYDGARSTLPTDRHPQTARAGFCARKSAVTGETACAVLRRAACTCRRQPFNGRSIYGRVSRNKKQVVNPFVRRLRGFPLKVVRPATVPRRCRRPSGAATASAVPSAVASALRAVTAGSSIAEHTKIARVGAAQGNPPAAPRAVRRKVAREIGCIAD